MSILPLKIDLHVHTSYSHDCLTSLDSVISFAQKRRLNGVSIADHDTIEGALRLLEMAGTGLIIIPGIEVSTSQGHLLGINVTTPIPRGLSIVETAARIHEAGGIAVAAHPSSPFKHAIGLDERLISYGVDAVETVNSTNFPFFLLNYLDKRLARRTGLPVTGGSDAHLPEAIGLGYTLIDETGTETDIDAVVQAIKRGRCVPIGRPMPWRLRLRKITLMSSKPPAH